MSKLLGILTVIIFSSVIWAVIFFGAFICFKGCTPAHASEINDVQAVMTIIGEAEGEPFEGKLAVACAIRNRGTLKGVYGLRAPRVLNHKYSKQTEQYAVNAWIMSEDSGNCEFIKGADHWEGDKFPKPSWSKKMVETAHIGHQIFYKEVEK